MMKWGPDTAFTKVSQVQWVYLAGHNVWPEPQGCSHLEASDAMCAWLGRSDFSIFCATIRNIRTEYKVEQNLQKCSA